MAQSVTDEWSWDSSVGIVTGRQRGRSSSPCRVKNFLFSTSSRPAVGPTQPGALSPGVKRPGREADCSPPASAEVNKTWMYIYLFPHTPSWPSA
jgi:hypothetical protein